MFAFAAVLPLFASRPSLDGRRPLGGNARRGLPRARPAALARHPGSEGNGRIGRLVCASVGAGGGAIRGGGPAALFSALSWAVEIAVAMVALQASRCRTICLTRWRSCSASTSPSPFLHPASLGNFELGAGSALVASALDRTRRRFRHRLPRDAAPADLIMAA